MAYKDYESCIKLLDLPVRLLLHSCEHTSGQGLSLTALVLKGITWSDISIEWFHSMPMIKNDFLSFKWVSMQQLILKVLFLEFSTSVAIFRRVKGFGTKRFLGFEIIYRDYLLNNKYSQNHPWKRVACTLPIKAIPSSRV